jgi:hypothetical protein
MFALDLFNTDHERRIAEGAVDQLEQRRIDDLAMKMDDLVARAKNPAYKKNPAALAALMKEFQKCKAERDGYFKIKSEAGIPGNVPVEKIPGKEDLLKGRGRTYYESQKKNSEQVDEYISMGSDKNYVEAEPYKNYKIYVRKKPFGNTGVYTAHTEVDRKEFMGKGNSQEEAVQAARDRIDFVLNAQKKVTGSSTIDFNVKFATDLLADPRQKFYAKLENISGQPKLVIASADVASDPELVAAGDFKGSALRNQVDDEGRATPLPGIPLTAKSLRVGDWIANGRYTIGNETTDRDGNRIFDLTYHSTAHTKSDKLRLNQPAFTLGTARELDEDKRLHIGDPITVTAPNEFEGKTGEIYDFSPSGTFVIVDLYNHGQHSMHLSDVEYNQYADDENNDDWYDDIDDGVRHAYDSDERTRSDQFEGYQDSSDSPVAGAITRRILLQRLDLLKQYGPELVGAAVDNVADYVGDVDEIGSSDVSGWVMQVERMLEENPPEAFAEGWSDAMVARRTGQPRTPYSVYIKGRKWKDFENDDHARAVMDKLRAKFKADGRDPSVITIAPTDIPEGAAEEQKPGFGQFPPKQEITIVPPKKLKSGETYQDRNKYWQSQGQAPIYKTNEVKADPTGSWVVYGGNKVVKFKTHTGAKAYAEKNGGKVASSEHYADKIQKSGVTETALNTRDPKGDYAAKRRALHDLSLNKDVDQAAVQQRRLDLDREARDKGVAEGSYNDYNNNRIGFGKRPREDDEYHVPDTVETQYNIKVNGQVINQQPFANRTAAVAWAKKAVAAGKLDSKTAKLSPINQVNELSTEKLAQYKKAAGADASVADKAGNFERGNKRFSGIVKATIKQGNNDAKKHPGVAEGAMSNLHADLADVYRRMAPSIERNRDSFKAGQLYDALEAVAEQHGAEVEFKRMMNGARNRAHMEYDTNPGGFQNWFWFLPFEDQELSEEQDTSGVERAILNRVMVAHTDLLMKFGPEKVMQAAEEVAYNVGDVDEIGTSDVSAYVNQVKQILGA